MESEPANESTTTAPTSASVLLWIAAANGSWFPAQFAAASGIPRDSLDEPLAELRLAELVRVAEWVRGVGQGFALTPVGAATVADPAAMEALMRGRNEIAATPPPQERNIEEVEVKFQSDAIFAVRPPLVVPALLLANAIVFLLCAVSSIRAEVPLGRILSRGDADALIQFGAVSGSDLLHGEWWRLLSACFVHIGALHLFGNLFALAIMGSLAELLWGRWRLLLIYFISGLAGSALAMALHPNSLLAGASGAIWGIQMSLFAWLLAFRHHLPPLVAIEWFRRLCGVFLLSAGVSFLPGVSWQGHLGGGLAGFIVAGLLNATRFSELSRRVTAWVLIAMLPLLCFGALRAAMEPNGLPEWRQIHKRLAAERAGRESNAIYKEKVRPLLAEIIPEATKFVEHDTGLLLTRTKRPIEKSAHLQEKVRTLRATADEVAKLLAADPHRERVHRFAVARAKSFELLLAMLGVDAPPSAEAWDAWQSARRDANRLWEELNAK